ncbi:class 1b ribonucleoside-diphosphate reductase subunit alpha [Brevibacillus laterosporus]|uniref:class 1b ribonucleoside-diphosphate reductase subunit alpha n=1 Tax=Brevibacillus laterosporus TaxID=1465 RepID=UPI003D1D1131
MSLARWIELNNEVKIVKDGLYQFEKDKEAVRDYMINFVNKNTMFFHDFEEKLDYMIENNYWDSGLTDLYTMEQLKTVFNRAYSYKFRFPSFMSAFKFYNNYALKTDDQANFLERYEDRVAMNALFIGKIYESVSQQAMFEEALCQVDNMMKQNYQPATPTFLNAGVSRGGEKVSCFLLSTPDSTEGIEYVNNSSAQLSRRGGGVGINLTRIRAMGESIKGTEGVSGGVVGVAKMLEEKFSYYNQNGKRDGSGVVYLNLFHADINRFLDTKKVNADEKVRLKTLSIGVVAPNKFFELAERGEPYYVFYPHNVRKVTGVELNDMDMNVWYEKLINNPAIKKDMLDPRLMLTKIAQIQQQSGYPYWMFIDNANKVHALKDIGRIDMSNLCNEIYQFNKHSLISNNMYDDKSNWGYDISCNLGSLNVVNVMENKDIENAVKLAVNALNVVVNETNIESVPTVAKGNNNIRSMGLGAMNLHGYFAKNEMFYDSDEALEFSNIFFMMVRYYAIQRSMEIARDFGIKFARFEESEYAKGREGNVFPQYLNKDFNPETIKVQRLYDGINIPTKSDWEKLMLDVQKYGMANGYLMAIAPTGSISYVQSATASITPITEQIETRTYGDSVTHYPMPYMTNENMFFYTPAYEVNMFKYIDLVATIQKHVDQGISTTLFVDSNQTTEDLVKYYIYAQKKGLKGLYYTRTKLLGVDECASCTV